MAQISATLSLSLYEKIKNIADKDRRTLSSTVELLLERAVKERNRKSKKQENNEI